MISAKSMALRSQGGATSLIAFRPPRYGVCVAYRGRGLIQITGLASYMTCGEALALDLLKQPELLEKPQHACMSAAWFWATKGLNTLADAGQFDKITQRINGGQNGAADRQVLYARALKVLA